MFKIDTIPIQ